MQVLAAVGLHLVDVADVDRSRAQRDAAAGAVAGDVGVGQDDRVALVQGRQPVGGDRLRCADGGAEGGRGQPDPLGGRSLVPGRQLVGGPGGVDQVGGAVRALDVHRVPGVQLPAAAHRTGVLAVQHEQLLVGAALGVARRLLAVGPDLRGPGVLRRRQAVRGERYSDQRTVRHLAGVQHRVVDRDHARTGRQQQPGRGDVEHRVQHPVQHHVARGGLLADDDRVGLLPAHRRRWLDHPVGAGAGHGQHTDDDAGHHGPQCARCILLVPAARRLEEGGHRAAAREGVGAQLVPA